VVVGGPAAEPADRGFVAEHGTHHRTVHCARRGPGAFAAYALAWIDFPGRDVVFIVVVALIVVPVQVAIIPDATIFRHLGIYGDIPAVIALHVAFRLPFAIFLFRNFFIGIPCDLLEATRMDGATEFGVFRLVVLPIGWPAIASLAIFQFLWVWNDLLVALVFATSDNGPMTQPTAERLLRVPAVLRTGRARRLRQVALANDSIDVCPLWRLPPGDRSGK